MINHFIYMKMIAANLLYRTTRSYRQRRERFHIHAA